MGHLGNLLKNPPNTLPRRVFVVCRVFTKEFDDTPRLGGVRNLLVTCGGRYIGRCTVSKLQYRLVIDILVI
jgi:hypothetical protein